VDQDSGSGLNLLDGKVELGLVGLGGLIEVAEFAHELKSGSLDLIFGSRGFEIEEGFDIAAHSRLL